MSVDNLKKVVINEVRTQILKIEQFLLYVTEKTQGSSLSESEKRNITLIYHRLWWFRDKLIKKYFPNKHTFNIYSPFLYKSYEASAEEDLQVLLAANPIYLNQVDLPSTLKTDIKNTLSFFEDRKDVMENGTGLVLHFESDGDLWCGDKTERCYSMGKAKKSLSIFKYLVEYDQKGNYISADVIALSLKDTPQNIRNTIGKIKKKIEYHLKLEGEDVIESNKGSGYRLNPGCKIILNK